MEAIINPNAGDLDYQHEMSFINRINNTQQEGEILSNKDEPWQTQVHLSN